MLEITPDDTRMGTMTATRSRILPPLGSATAGLGAGTLGDVATVHLPARVPQGFHGNWIPAS